jgi:hypothetical protein
MQKKYKLVNITVKPPKMDQRTGRDLRTAEERLGYQISCRNDDNSSVIITPTQPRIVSSVNEGMLKLARGGLLRIEEIEDVVTVLKQHSGPARAVPTSTNAQRKKTIDESPIFSPDEHVVTREAEKIQEKESKQQTGTAYPMGDRAPEKVGGVQYSDAVNPDGDPNFIASPAKNLKKRNKYQQMHQDSEQAKSSEEKVSE